MASFIIAPRSADEAPGLAVRDSRPWGALAVSVGTNGVSVYLYVPDENAFFAIAVLEWEMPSDVATHIAVNVDRRADENDAFHNGVRFYINGIFVKQVSGALPYQPFLPANLGHSEFGSYEGLIDQVWITFGPEASDDVVHSVQAGYATMRNRLSTFWPREGGAVCLLC